MANDPRDILARNRQEAQSLVERVGVFRARKVLQNAELSLQTRIRGLGNGTFTATSAKATLMQVRQVLKEVKVGVRSTLEGAAPTVADHAAGGVIDYLAQADSEFRGIAQPLALKEAKVLDAGAEGAQASLLRRLASSGEPVENADEEPSPAKEGILERYGMNVIDHFEEILQSGVITRASWAEMRANLIEQSSFLQGAPASWAERIVRTELMGAYNRSAFEATREADDQLDDMVKIISATFDDRTAADSYATHGQIRLPEEAFETWYGLMQHPPDRPNDRGIVVPHRISWIIPPYLAWRSQGEIIARWKKDKRKGAPPERPLMTTVDIARFGRDQPKRRKRVVAEDRGEDDGD